MTLRWKRKPKLTGLHSIGAAPRGSNLHDGEHEYASTCAYGHRDTRKGWYWTARNDAKGIALVNTSNDPLPDEAAAKAAAMAYVKACIAAMGRIEFKADGTFQAMYAAEDWLKAHGFSVGPSQVDGPCAIWHGDCVISKWRNLSKEEKRDVHAIMEGDLRNGPVRIVLMPGATPEARAAFMAGRVKVA